MKSKYLKNTLAIGFSIALILGSAGCGSTTQEETASKKENKVAESETSDKNDETVSNAESVESKDEETYDGEVTKIYAVTMASPRPFTFYGDDGELQGHDIELVNAVFDKLPQYELVMEISDYAGLFAGIDSDKYQILVNNCSMNEERKEKYLFTDPILQNARLIVANKDVDLGDDDTVSLDQLAGLSYVGSSGIGHTTTMEDYNKANPEHQIDIRYSDDDVALQIQSVNDGKFDFTCIDAPMFDGYYNPEFQYDNLNSKLLKVDSQMYSYFIVGKGHDQLVKDINEALQEVYAEGTSTEICEKYFGGDYTPFSFYG